jgi:hypothetical protein
MLFRRHQLFAVVDPRGFRGRRFHGHHADGFRGPRDDVGQVVLALRIARGELGHGLAQEGGGPGVDAGVHLVDFALGGPGVLVLDHIADFARVVAHHAAVAGRIGHHRGQHGQATGLLRLANQRGQGFSAQERHVAVHDGDQSVEVGQRFQAQADRVASALLLLLLDHRNAVRPETLVEGLLHLILLMPEHGHDGRGAEVASALDRVRHHGNPQQGVKHLVLGGIHAGSLPRSQDQTGEAIDMETLRGFPNLPAMVRGRQSRPAPRATWTTTRFH